MREIVQSSQRHQRRRSGSGLGSGSLEASQPRSLSFNQDVGEPESQTVEIPRPEAKVTINPSKTKPIASRGTPVLAISLAMMNSGMA